MMNMSHFFSSRKVLKLLTCSMVGALLLMLVISLRPQAVFAATYSPLKPTKPLGGGGFSFVQTTTRSNTNGDYTVLDNASINGNESAVVLAAPALDVSHLVNGFSFDSTRVGVEYDYQLKRWTIVNEDRSSMPIGVRFNVQGAISQMPQEGAFSLPVDEVDLTTDGQVRIANAFSINNPNAEIVVTPEIYQPNPARDTHNLSVLYDSGADMWMLSHADGTPIEPNEVYNIVMWPQSSAHVVSTVSTNTYGLLACIDDSTSNTNPAATPIVTLKSTTNPAVTDPLGMLYNPFNAEWCVFDMAIAPLPLDAQFTFSLL